MRFTIDISEDEEKQIRDMFIEKDEKYHLLELTNTGRILKNKVFRRLLLEVLIHTLKDQNGCPFRDHQRGVKGSFWDGRHITTI